MNICDCSNDSPVCQNEFDEDLYPVDMQEIKINLHSEYHVKLEQP